jgi:hypothetical protein
MASRIILQSAGAVTPHRYEAYPQNDISVQSLPHAQSLQVLDGLVPTAVSVAITFSHPVARISPPGSMRATSRVPGMPRRRASRGVLRVEAAGKNSTRRSNRSNCGKLKFVKMGRYAPRKETPATPLYASLLVARPSVA